MKPLGDRKLGYYRGKRDIHPPKGWINWWETIITRGNKSFEKEKVRNEIKEQLEEIAS